MNALAAELLQPLVDVDAHRVVVLVGLVAEAKYCIVESWKNECMVICSSIISCNKYDERVFGYIR